MKYRIAVVASHVIQYQDPFFRLLAADPQLEVTVFYGSRAGAEVYRDEDMKTDLQWDLELLHGYRHEFLPNFGFGDGYSRLINPTIVPRILRGDFDAVTLFLGWGSISSLLAIAACRVSRTPFFLFGDSSFPPTETTFASKVRALFLRSVFTLASGFLTSGALNAEYYRHYGGDPRRFFLVPWAVDNERFASASAMSQGERRALREGLGFISEETVYVFSAKLVARKDPMTLIRAVATLPRGRAAVLFLGDGELRDALERFARENQVKAVFAGFVNQTELPRHYAAADVFVLPSTYEPRGAVVNEAMACGLPVVVTDRCGSIGDIVLEGENAFVYEAGNAEALAEKLRQLVDDTGLRQRMGARSREIIATWNYERGVRGITEALRATCSR